MPRDSSLNVYADDPRITKRSRTSSDGPRYLRYAREPATLRKARSLRSDASSSNVFPLKDLMTEYLDVDLNYTRPHSSCSHQLPDDLSQSEDFGLTEPDLASDYIPTAPVSCVPSLGSPLPILWPLSAPEGLLINANADDVAEGRLTKLLEVEARARKAAGWKTEGRFVNRVTRDTMPRNTEGGYEDCMSVNEEYRDEVQDFRTEIDLALRGEIIEWMLTVMPPSDAKKTVSMRNLREQLLKDPDTSFFSVYIFGQYLWIVAPPAIGESQEARAKSWGNAAGTKVISYELALAAVSIAVKYQRDVLNPLAPIFAKDFIALSKHKLSFQDFELAQRELLLGLAYDLSMPTPQPLLDELRASLPLLRRAVPLHKWDAVLQDVWWQMLRTVRHADIFRFPLSLLTATALRESLSRLVVPAPSNSFCACGGSDISVKDLSADVRDVLGYSEDAMKSVVLCSTILDLGAFADALGLLHSLWPLFTPEAGLL
ncbi:hypothetical protein K488DRAFT_89117 [Vararia minispora EC-137]|uniref:Uncharacterized protein n=1 Tax=Vararia minispora EC-137 TaxID=1314806 RepID=A0ACB8QBK1_9AGAM|nr:hypothetical protein K488DRAFT_89117 [Vararia minispora EC-137]